MGPRERKIYTTLKKGNLFVREVKTDVLHDSCLRLMVRENGRELIVPRTSEINKIVKFTYDAVKGEGARKIFDRLKKLYTGISRDYIQSWLNENKQHHQNNPTSGNKPPLRPVIASTVQSHHQIDLVNFDDYPVEKNGKVYLYALSVLDVFSRFIQLRPLTSKESKEVRDHIDSIYRYDTIKLNQIIRSI